MCGDTAVLVFCHVYVLSELIHLGWAGNFGDPLGGELSTLVLLEAEPLLAPTPSRVDSVIDRGKGILKSAGALSFVCCSLNSFQISGSTTCSTMASAASVVLLGVAEGLVWKLEESCLSRISTSASQMQIYRYLQFHHYSLFILNAFALGVCTKRGVVAGNLFIG